MNNPGIALGVVREKRTEHTKQGKEIHWLVLTTGPEARDVLALKLFGRTKDAADKVHEGDSVAVTYVCESRQWEDRYFSDAVAKSVELIAPGTKVTPKPAPSQKAFADDSEIPF